MSNIRGQFISTINSYPLSLVAFARQIYSYLSRYEQCSVFRGRSYFSPAILTVPAGVEGAGGDSFGWFELVSSLAIAELTASGRNVAIRRISLMFCYGGYTSALLSWYFRKGRACTCLVHRNFDLIRVSFWLKTSGSNWNETKDTFQSIRRRFGNWTYLRFVE